MFIRKIISQLGFCPSCLRRTDVYAFVDSVCSVCYEKNEDGNGLKKLLFAIIASTLAFLGYGDYSNKTSQIEELRGQVEELKTKQEIERPLGAGVIDNGIRGIANPKYWSKK